MHAAGRPRVPGFVHPAGGAIDPARRRGVVEQFEVAVEAQRATIGFVSIRPYFRICVSVLVFRFCGSCRQKLP